MKYFVAPEEDRQLDEASRQGLRGNFIALSDGVTHYELTGPLHGELAVLVGSLTIPLFYWDGVATQLHGRGFRTLACSAYGRGYSDRARGAYDEALFVRQLAELIASLGLSQPQHMVAASMGALIAMAYAGQRAASISTLTLVGPAGLARPIAAPHRLLHSDRVAGFVAKRFGRRVFERHQRSNIRDPDCAAALAAIMRDPTRYEGSLYAFFATLQGFPLFGRAELYRRTRKLEIPTMLVWGRDDQVTPLGNLDKARSLLQPLRCEVIEQCGHMAAFERPLEVADKIASFAGAHTRSRRYES